MREHNSTKPYLNIWESTKGALSGFIHALRREKKVRHVCYALITAVFICIVADVGYFQILIVILSWMIALICEIFNTALEKALDYACNKEFHPLVKQGKDYASACTFISLVFAVSLTIMVAWSRHFGKERPVKAFEVACIKFENEKGIVPI